MDYTKVQNCKLISINIDELDYDPGPYQMSFGFDNSKLITSINEIGLLNTPFIIKGNDGGGRFQIVSGYRRIMALNALGIKEISCKDLSHSGMSKTECLIFNLMDNLPTREFNNIEKGMILNRLSEYFSEREIREKYLPLLNISGKNKMDVLRKTEALSETEKEHIANGSISLKAIEMIFELNKKSISCLFDLIIKIKLNFNQQIQFIEYISDISIKENKPIDEIIKTGIFDDAFNDRNPNTRQKASFVIEILRTMRFPLYADCERSFKKNINKLELPKNVNILHPPFFETPDFKLEISFKTGTELKETIDKLADNNDLRSVSEIWSHNS